MKTTHLKRRLVVAAALAVAVSSPAFADKGHGHGERGHNEVAHNEPAHNEHGNNPKAEGRHDNGRHEGWQKKAWKRGDRIVWVDVDPRYYVEDYRAYRLSAPPPGYRWIRPMDDRYLLVDVTSGLIAQALGY